MLVEVLVFTVVEAVVEVDLTVLVLIVVADVVDVEDVVVLTVDVEVPAVVEDPEPPPLTVPWA